MAESLTLCKLIVLKLLHEAASPLTGALILDFVLGKEYTGYFSLRQALSELEETGHVTVHSNHSASLYRITGEGENTLHCLGDKISPDISREIRSYLAEKKVEIHDHLTICADYYPGNTGNDCFVRCQVREQDSTLIDLTLCVPSEKLAISVCDHWKEKSQELYAHIMKTLL